MRCFKLEIYVPATHADTVRLAIGEAGAGRLGNYDCCIWECAGTGHFRAGCSLFVPFSGPRRRCSAPLLFFVDSSLQAALRTPQLPKKGP